jgi:hypothetical protein
LISVSRIQDLAPFGSQSGPFPIAPQAHASVVPLPDDSTPIYDPAMAVLRQPERPEKNRANAIDVTK